MFYHTLDGEFNNAWRFANGKVIKEVTQVVGTDLDLNMKARKKVATDVTCVYTTYEVWSQNCTDYYTNGEYDATACGEWYSDGTNTDVECHSSGDTVGNTGGNTGVDPNGGYTGGGGTGGNNNSGGGVTTNQVRVEILIPLLKATLEQMGISTDGIIFRYGEPCRSYARVYNGAIE